MKKRRHAQQQQHKRRSDALRDEGSTLIVKVERIVPGGFGLAHAEGRTLFVALAAPGDLLRVRLSDVRKRLAFASIIDVIEPSPLRVEPSCPYFGRCGGCDFQQLGYSAQLEAKLEILRDCLRRIAHLEPPTEITIQASPEAWRYRSRAQWQLDPLRKHLGYFERGSHRVCDVAECPVIVEPLQSALTDLRERLRSSSDPLPEEAGEFQAVAGDEGVSIIGPSLDRETGREVSRNINGTSYRFSADGFFQINHELLPSLLSAATRDTRGASAIDLYCGVGLFTLPLAGSFERVVGVEANEQAIRFARRNAREAQLNNAEFECARVSDWLRVNGAAHGAVDLVLLDPPRAGAEEGAIEGILALRPRLISYVSCDPATLARDLKSLTGGGYRLDSIEAFDMFPQTHHIETVVRLSSDPPKYKS